MQPGTGEVKGEAVVGLEGVGVMQAPWKRLSSQCWLQTA